MPLSDIQLRVATIVLALAEADEFALAGGAALVIHEVVDRGTKDLDCFGPSTAAVNALIDPAIAALTAQGMSIEVMISNDGFAKLFVNDGPNLTQLDIGFDPADHESVPSIVGPLRDLRDLAGDKLLALFSRAAPRDFIDIAGLLHRFSKGELCAIASNKDSGFNLDVLADAFGMLPSYDRDDEYPGLADEEYAALLEVFADWQAEIRAR